MRAKKRIWAFVRPSNFIHARFAHGENSRHSHDSHASRKGGTCEQRSYIGEPFAICPNVLVLCPGLPLLLVLQPLRLIAATLTLQRILVKQ
jgi:hypothetical protein